MELTSGAPLWTRTSLSVKTLCERDETALASVEKTCRFSRPAAMTASAS